MNDFTAEPSELKEQMLAAVNRVIQSGWYVLGKEVQKFEDAWASAIGVDQGIGVANGMDAIEIALRSLGIGSGDEVITTPMTAFATTLAILRSGATPVLADIDPDTALISVESATRCLTTRTKAIVLVHLYGQLRNLDQWVNFCTSNNIYLIEDCAQSHLASLSGKKGGSFGVAGAFSFYPTKNLGTVGDGGMLVTSDAKLSEKARSLRNYGQTIRYSHPYLGMNSRLDEIHAAILLERLGWLGIFTARRRAIAKAYYEGINNSLISLMAKPQEELSHVYHLFVVKCLQRDLLQQHLQSNDIQSYIHYPIPIHLQESCFEIARDPQGLNNSEIHAQLCLSLPCHPQMSDKDVASVIAVVNSFTGM
ncbi:MULTISPECIES: DegT/DnrJ/EryC1/StrS family aminotransferase [unclassified Polaromonas]|jgi:dTDP-4-amino-4,6-dideoxygalactose transaminase|uniref:DegT/DnrJ/EryC1/StrS family aminotransferase n=1 Tax=unclassified Polaromonas TaxID=2638319 RepID=UPI0025EF01C5|nr:MULTISPECIES: DegT/DnrJ/EryC1/StrS family aminotransferase [unclassified Polaromonas]